MSTNLRRIKFIPLNSYNVSSDAEDEICAVDVTSMFGTGSFPDWSRAVGLSAATTYTVGSGALANYRAGYIWCGGGRGGYRWCSINGVSFLGGYDYQDGHEGKLIFCPVSIGDYFRAEGNIWNFIFIPSAWSL